MVELNLIEQIPTVSGKRRTPPLRSLVLMVEFFGAKVVQLDIRAESLSITHQSLSICVLCKG